MNDDTSAAIGVRTNVDEIKEKHSKLAEKSPERLKDIECMIDYLKGEEATNGSFLHSIRAVKAE